MGRYLLALVLLFAYAPFARGACIAPDVSGEVNIKSCTDADLGAKINSAFAIIPNGGKILIPPGTYSFATTVQCPITGGAPFIIEGAGRAQDGSLPPKGATVLTYTGSGDAFNQVITNSSYVGSAGCVLRDLTLNGPGAGTATVGFHFGGTNYTAIQNVGIGYFGSGIELENAAAGGVWTERYNIGGGTSLHTNGKAIYFHKDGGGNISFEHGKIDVWLNVEVGEYGIYADGGGNIGNSTIYLDGNVEGSGSGGTLVSAVGSMFITDYWILSNECSETSCVRFAVDSTSNITGSGIDDLTGNSWSNNVTAGGTLAFTKLN
jgi:hypothetical protein